MKKCCSILLCCILVLASTGMAFADDGDVSLGMNDLSLNQNPEVDVIAMLSNEGEKLASEIKVEAQSEQSILVALGYDNTTIQAASIVDDDIQYELDNNVQVSTLAIEENAEGDITFEFAEGSKQDELCVTCDGEIYINNDLVVVNTSSNLETATSGATSYVATLPANCGSASDYTIYQRLQVVHMKTVNKFSSYTVGTLSGLIAFIFKMPGGWSFATGVASMVISNEVMGQSDVMGQTVQRYYSKYTHTFLINRYTGVDRRVAKLYYNDACTASCYICTKNYYSYQNIY